MSNENNVHTLSLGNTKIQNTLDVIESEVSEASDEVVHQQLAELGIKPCSRDRLNDLGMVNKELGRNSK